MPSVSGPTAMSTSNVELVAAEADYEDESEELAVLGLMEFEVLPADRLDKSKRYKPYDRPKAKKGVEKTLPESTSCLKDPQPNRAYVELPPMILKHAPPTKVPYSPVEDQEMVDDVVPVQSKGKQKELPVFDPILLRETEDMPLKPRIHTSALKEMPKFEVVNPKFSNEKMKAPVPQYKYMTELMNGINQEQVYQNVMEQLVTLKLSKLLGSSYDLGQRLQSTMRSQCFPLQQVNVANAEVVPKKADEEQDLISFEEDKNPTETSEAMDLFELSETFEFAAESREAQSSCASTEELHELSYQNMMQEDYIHQFIHPIKEVNLACPHEYCAMVTA